MGRGRLKPVLSDESILSDNRLLTGPQAAGHLGVTRASIYHMVKVGVLPYVDIRQKKDGRLPVRGWRFRIGDLDALILNRRNRLPRWDAMSETLPRLVVQRLLGVSHAGVHNRLHDGTLDDCTPEAVRRAIEKTYRRKFYKEMSAEFITKMRKMGVCPVCKHKKGIRAKRGTAA